MSRRFFKTGFQSIITDYRPPTARKGGRIRAVGGGSIVEVSYDHGLTNADNAEHAVEALCQSLGWHGDIVHTSADIKGLRGARVFSFMPSGLTVKLARE